MKKLKKFLIEAKKETYANENVKQKKSSRLKSRDYEYKKRNMMNEMNTISDENIRVPKCEEE